MRWVLVVWVWVVTALGGGVGALAQAPGQGPAPGGAQAQAPAPAQAQAPAQAPAQAQGWLGVEVRDLTKDEAEALGLEGPRGAWVVKPIDGSPAAKAGLAAGDIIVSLDGVEIDDHKALIAALVAKAPGAEVKLRLMREKRFRPLTITLAARPAPVARAPGPSPLHLMLDTGGHMGLIRGLAWTPDGRQIVSAGDDKVIRVWDVATGKTVRTIRGEIGPGSEGKIFAMALSPDGRWLAAGGWLTGPIELTRAIRLYDLATGEPVALLKGHTNVVFGLAFSADGRRLISGGGDNRAIVWEAGPEPSGGWRAGRLLHRLEGHTDDIYAVGFTPDGARAVTGSYDTTLRLWTLATTGGGPEAGGKPIGQPMTGHKDKVRALAVNPRDGSIVSGSNDGEIRVWDGMTGRFVRSIVERQERRVGALAIDQAGRRVLAASAEGKGRRMNSVFDFTAGQSIRTYQEHDNAVVAAAISPDGQWAATGGGNNNEIHIWEIATGERRRGPDGQPLTLGGTGAPGWAAGVSPDGRWLAWGSNWQKLAGGTGHSSETGTPFEFQLRLPDMPQGQTQGSDPTSGLGRPTRMLRDDAKQASARGQTLGPGGVAPSSEQAFLRARPKHGSWSLAHRPGGNYGYDDAILDIRDSGKPVASITRGATDGYGHNAYSFTPDGRAIVSGGGSGALIAYDLAGRALARFVGHEGDDWAVTPSADGSLLVTGSDDQTVRLWSLAPLADPDVVPTVGRLPPKIIRPIVTLFHGRDGEWVMWTPEGYYTASAKGAELVGWQINRGPETAPDYISAGQLRDHFNRPDIVEKAIVLASSAEAVRTSHGTNFKLEDLIQRPAPRLAVLSPAANSTAHGGRVALKFRIDATPDAVQAIRVHVNGNLVAEKTPPIGAGGFEAGEHSYEIPLARGRNQIVLTAKNAVGWSDPKQGGSLVVVHDDDGDLDKRGVLHLVAIGVNDYKALGNVCGDGKQSCDLALPSADARAFAATMEQRLGPAHSKVERRILINGAGATQPPTAANILDALDQLKAARENDTVVLFIAGHGINEGASYNFLATDAAMGPAGFQTRTIVPWYAIQTAVETARGRRILFVDTCHSGNAYNQKLDGAAYHANIIAYTAARWDQLASEDQALGNGLFTYAVVEGVNGKAAPAGSRAITTSGLAAYVASRVSELAANMQRAQNPQYFRGRDAEDYVLVK